MAVKKKRAVAKKRIVKKAVAKKAVAKKATTKKKVATKKKVSKKKSVVAPVRLKSITTKQTKNQIIQAIAEDTSLSKKEVGEVFGSLQSLIQRHMQRRGSGEFAIPDTGVKIRKVQKPARKARMGRNPATGETIKIAAKPKSTVIKVGALKQLKDMLN